MKTNTLFKNDFYQRLGGLQQFRGRKVLDLGCGSGEDSKALAKFASKVVGLDIYKDPSWKEIKNKKISFILGKAEKLPFKNGEFTGLFLKDVLHHVDEIKKTLQEIKRVTAENSLIILVEGNRYNPLFYLHMTKMRGHEHLSQKSFKKLVLEYFPTANFKFFEAHYIPLISQKLYKKLINFERTLDKISFLRPFLSYNIAIIH